jgi:GWxTD domain-containing protein
MIDVMRRYPMRRTVLASVLVLLGSLAVFADDQCIRLFLKAKEQFKMAQYDAALATLDALAAEAEKPGNEKYRTQLPAGLAFYRGACFAALGRTDEAREKFETFLTYTPNASLDPSAYPPKVIAALEETRRAMNVEKEKPAETGSLATSYRAYVAPVEKGAEEAGEDWAEGPVRFLLTGEQKEDYVRLSDPASRSEFITEFWKVRDPKSETPENEARIEFERRVAFADARFSQEETRGSLTDRGMIFVLMGPPTWVGRKPITTGDDANDPKGMQQYSDLDVRNALRGTSSVGSARVYDKMTHVGTKLPNADGNYREVWHFRRELLPKGVSYQQVDFEFITRAGYGENVWNREPRTLTTLEKARNAVRAGTFTRAAAR